MKHKKIILLMIIALAVGMTIGFVMGVEYTIKKGVFLFKVLIDDGSITFDYDREVLESLISRYMGAGL